MSTDGTRFYLPVGAGTLRAVEAKFFQCLPADEFNDDYVEFFGNLSEARGVAHFEIAKTAPDSCGYVLCFMLDRDATTRFAAHSPSVFVVDRSDAQEFNDRLIGAIEVVARYEGLK